MQFLGSLNFLTTWTGWFMQSEGKRPRCADVDYLTSAPRLVVNEIMKRLPFADIVSLATTCSRMAKASRLGNLWSHLIVRDYGIEALRRDDPREAYLQERLCHEDNYLRHIAVDGGIPKADGWGIMTAQPSVVKKFLGAVVGCLVRRGDFCGLHYYTGIASRVRKDVFWEMMQVDEFTPGINTWTIACGALDLAEWRSVLDTPRFRQHAVTSDVFTRACMIGHLPLVKLFIDDGGFDVNAKGGDALLTAVIGHNAALVSMLLQASAIPTREILLLAARSGNIDVVRAFLACELCDLERHGSAMLEEAIQYDRTDAANLLAADHRVVVTYNAVRKLDWPIEAVADFFRIGKPEDNP